MIVLYANVIGRDANGERMLALLYQPYWVCCMHLLSKVLVTFALYSILVIKTTYTELSLVSWSCRSLLWS